MDKQIATNITWQHGNVTRQERRANIGQRGATIWMTGLSASGKSTLAAGVEKALLQQGMHAYVLDGDNVRHGLNKNLGFSAEDRAENIRRVSEVTRLFADAGLISITSFISPYRADRDMARPLHEEAQLPFHEVYLDVPLEVAERRDPKGLSTKARAGEIKGFTGVDDPYEVPEGPDLHLHTDLETVEESVQRVLDLLEEHDLLGH